MSHTPVLILVLCLAARAIPATAGEVVVASAADLNFAMKAMAAQFEKETGHHVRLSFGSSGNFYSQIVNGAPFDLFFSADMSYVRRLEAAGKAEPGTLFVYAIGRLVLWVNGRSAIDPAGSGMNALLDPSAGKIAIANPVHAPYGRAAVAAMEHAGIFERVRGKLVSGESVLQAAQFVQSGAAEIGIIPLSLALAPVMLQSGRYWMIPPDSYPRIEQGALILARARQDGHLPAAQAFRAWVRGRPGRDVLARFGFALPEETNR